MTINKERVELWVAALEAEDPELQGRWTQKRRDKETGAMLHCTLGIGSRVAVDHGVPLINESGVNVYQAAGWDQRVMDFYGFDISNPCIESGDIVTVNDLQNKSFWHIAQEIRARYLKDEG